MAEADPAADAKSVAALRAKVSTSRDATQKVRGISCSASPASPSLETPRPLMRQRGEKLSSGKPPSSHTPWPVPHDSQEAMQNLAYVVSSANDNIQALQRTIKQQERELAAASDHASALQRNYETLARIRRADQEEFLVVKAQQTEEREQMKQLKAELAAERERCAELERSLQQSAAAQAESQSLKLQLADASRERDDHLAEVERLRGSAAEMLDANKVLKINIDKLSRAQQEMLIKARKADDALRSLQGEKEAADKASASSASKAAVQERQLKTFLQANEALEADLRKQLSRVAALERRKQEQEAEQQTIEAYYQARLEEMQAQYDRLLADRLIDVEAKHAPKQPAFD